MDFRIFIVSIIRRYVNVLQINTVLHFRKRYGNGSLESGGPSPLPRPTALPHAGFSLFTTIVVKGKGDIFVLCCVNSLAKLRKSPAVYLYAAHARVGNVSTQCIRNYTICIF